MAYLTAEEYTKFFNLGEAPADFENLEHTARVSVDLYTRNLYHYTKLENEPEHRKQAVKLAMAYQVRYLEASGITSADDKQALESVQIGRTSLKYRDTSKQAQLAGQFNLSLDALNQLNAAGFGYIGAVDYDRH